jgi:hypothetical protein
MSHATIKESFEPITDNLYKDSADDDYDNPPFGPLPYREYEQEGYRRVDHGDNGINNLLANKPNDQTYFKDDYDQDTIIDDSTFDYIKKEAKKKDEGWKINQDIKIPNFSQNFSNEFKGSKTIKREDVEYSDDSQNEKMLKDFLKQRDVKPNNVKALFNRDANPTYNPNVLVQYHEKVNGDNNKNVSKKKYKSPKKTPEAINFTDAITMAEYHNQMYNQQLKESIDNRKKVQEQSLQNWQEYNALANKISANYKADYEEKTNKLKSLYPEMYKKIESRPGYSEMDNHIDNLNPKKYEKVELPDPKSTETPKYHVIGSYEDQDLTVGGTTNDTNTYRTPYGKYFYDPSNDNIYPSNTYGKSIGSLYNENNESGDKVSEKLFKLKYKDDSNNNDSGKTSDSEKFIDVDPKLSDIYKKILTMPLNTNENKNIQNESWSMLYGYILCLIIVLILFLLFKP